MNEEKFKELLKKLKIAENKSYEDIMELLDAKLDEYLDRQDEASKEVVSQIHDALDYAEEMQKEVGSGITIKSDQEEEEAPDFDDLKDATNKKEDTAKTKGMTPPSSSSSSSSSDSKGSAKGRLWFVSKTGAANVDNMFLQAEDDLKYGEWEHATDIFEMILQVEANNPSAYLGRVLAKYQLSMPREIGSCIDKPINADVNLRRAHDHGNAAQAKYIEDALKERENAVKYKEAEKAYQGAKTDKDFQNAASMFNNISFYRDADARSTQCLNKAKELAYQRACDFMRYGQYDEKKAKEAIDIFSSLKGYKDSYWWIKQYEERDKRSLYEEGVKLLKEKSSSLTLRDAAYNFKQIKGYEDADTLLEKCEQLIPELEGMERKNKDVEQFEKALSSAESNTDNRIRYKSALLECKSVYKKVEEIIKNSDKEAQYYNSVSLNEWHKRIKEVEKDRNNYLKESRREVLMSILLIIFTFLLGPFWVLNFNGSISIPDFLTHLPISCMQNHIEIEDSTSPVLFSLAPGNIEIELRNSNEYEKVITPFANDISISYVNTDNILIPKKTTEVFIRDCDTLSEVTIPKGVTKVTIEDCNNLRKIEWPEGIDLSELDIYLHNNPLLEDN